MRNNHIYPHSHEEQKHNQNNVLLQNTKFCFVRFSSYVRKITQAGTRLITIPNQLNFLSKIFSWCYYNIFSAFDLFIVRGKNSLQHSEEGLKKTDTGAKAGEVKRCFVTQAVRDGFVWAFLSVSSIWDERAVGEMYGGTKNSLASITRCFISWPGLIKEGDSSYCEEIPLNSISETWRNECAVVNAKFLMKDSMKWLEECFPVMYLLLNCKISVYHSFYPILFTSQPSKTLIWTLLSL